MKFAVMADIHANLEALQAVLVDAAAQECTEFVFLGDYVGYGADPKPCVDLIRSLNAPSVKGNYDDYCATDEPLEGITATAALPILWTRQQLTEDDRAWLRRLPLLTVVKDFTIVHATLDRPETWGYVFDKASAAASFALQKTRLCFFGHTHTPVAFIRDIAVRSNTFTKFRLETGKSYFVNPGSVGQPRDGNPNAAYVVYDFVKNIIELRRVPYDSNATEQKIRGAGLD